MFTTLSFFEGTFPQSPKKNKLTLSFWTVFIIGFYGYLMRFLRERSHQVQKNNNLHHEDYYTLSRSISL